MNESMVGTARLGGTSAVAEESRRNLIKNFVRMPLEWTSDAVEPNQNCRRHNRSVPGHKFQIRECGDKVARYLT